MSREVELVEEACREITRTDVAVFVQVVIEGEDAGPALPAILRLATIGYQVHANWLAAGNEYGKPPSKKAKKK